MIIRRATVWDAVNITDMWRQMVSEVGHLNTIERDPEIFYLQLLVRIKSPTHRILVAEEDGKLIGFITGNLIQAEYSNKIVGFCDNSFVVDNKRGHRVYLDLIKSLEDEGRALGAISMQFQFRYDPKAEKFWERQGFKPSFIVYEKGVT